MTETSKGQNSIGHTFLSPTEIDFTSQFQETGE